MQIDLAVAEICFFFYVAHAIVERRPLKQTRAEGVNEIELTVPLVPSHVSAVGFLPVCFHFSLFPL